MKNISKLLLAILLLLHSSNLSANEGLTLFNDTLKPATQELLSIYHANKKADSNLNSIIEELRNKAYEPKASDESKQDLAAFLIKKVMLQRELPYESNEELLREASDILPNNFHIESLWGDLLFFAGDYESCIAHYEIALSKNPDSIDLTGKYGLACLNMLNYEKALEYIQTYLTKNPNEFYYLFSAGRCQFELHNYEEAIEYFEKAKQTTNNPNNIAVIEEYIRKAKEAAASTSDSTRDEDQRFVITFAGNSRDDLGDVTFDMLDEIYYDVTSLLGYNPEVKINIIFFLTEDYYKQGQDWSAGAAQGIQIMIPLKSGYKSQEYVKGLLAHEFTHTLINLKTNNRAPLWVHEGLAQYQEYSTSYGSPEIIRSDFQKYLENDFIENGLFIPLDKVPAYIGGSNNSDVVRGYVAAYMGIRCLADLYGEQSFDTLLSSLGKGKSISEAISETTGKSYKEFQEELKDFIKNQ